jgi:hypothetical protein
VFLPVFLLAALALARADTAARPQLSSPPSMPDR